MKRLVLILALLVVFPLVSKAGILLPESPAYSMRESNLIVVATLESVSEFTLGDRGFRRGTLVIQEVLWGHAKVGDRIPYRWETSFSPTACYPSPRGNISEKGIWFLTITEDGSVAAHFPADFFELKSRREVKMLLASGVIKPLLESQPVRQVSVFQAAPLRAADRRMPLMRATAVLLLALFIFLKLYRD